MHPLIYTVEGFSNKLYHSSSYSDRYFSEAIPDFFTSNFDANMAYESSSSLDTGSMVYSPMVHESRLDKIRMSTEGSTTCLSSAQHKDANGSKSRKQKRINGGVKEVEEKAKGHGDVKAKQACGEPPAGYIHVRARRGQATDSHSLAERARREKISERMKMLQSLVPGCDKVTGKALMLDEIINYVQSLQNQVEFLSMKLASMNPMFYEFGVDIDSYPDFRELLKMGAMPHELVQCLGQANQITADQHTTFDGATTMDYQVAMNTNASPLSLGHTTFDGVTTMDYQVAMNTSASHLSLQGQQGPTAFAQDGSSRMMQVSEQGQGLLNQVEFNSMCSFQ